MRVGDILICKKNYKKRYNAYLRSNMAYVAEYEKDQEYTILEIVHSSHWYSPGKYKQHINISYNIYKLENNDGYYYGRDFIDIRANKSQSMNYGYIWDYFYTIKEWRKLKLKKIENQRKNKSDI
jgi:hypothetical protein